MSPEDAGKRAEHRPGLQREEDEGTVGPGGDRGGSSREEGVRDVEWVQRDKESGRQIQNRSTEKCGGQQVIGERQRQMDRQTDRQAGQQGRVLVLMTPARLRQVPWVAEPT